MKYILFISLLVTLVSSRPQNPKEDSGVEIEKQTIVKLPNSNGKSRQFTSEEEKIREAETKDILEKIAQVNLNQGLTPKTIKKPFYSFSTHQQKQQSNESKGKQLPNFQFSNTPMGNPIFDYLQRNQNKLATKSVTVHSDDDDDDDEIPEGYTIKRKVTHQQTLIIPSYPHAPEPYYNPTFSSLPVQSQFVPTRGGHYGLVPINQMNYNNQEIGKIKSKNDTNQNKTLDELTLAKQNFLISNIKNIISNSQNAPNYYPNPVQINPYQPYPYNYDPYALRMNPYSNPYASVQNYLSTTAQLPSQNPNQKFSDTYYANLQTAQDSAKFLGSNQNNEAASRQMTPPFSEYFPIVIKNPFQQMFQAFTSMIEYGPNSNLCRSHPKDKHSHNTEEELISRSGKAMKEAPNIVIKNKGTREEVVIQKLEETTEINNDNDFYIEGLKISEAEKTPNKKSESEVRQIEEESIPETEILIEEDKFFNHHNRYPQKDEALPIPSTPVNGGIFIHKLKVRKGGVAIAGPGGIATAGSGGTAVVGPNGFAYTQPNGVAIAGPGSKVISVDPSVDLTEFVQNMSKNKTLTRFGKVVAVGPVVYHDLGQQ